MIIRHVDNSQKVEIFFESKEFQGLLNNGYIKFEAKTGKLFADAAKIENLIYQISHEIVLVKDVVIHDASEKTQTELMKDCRYPKGKCYAKYLTASLKSSDAFIVPNAVFRFDRDSMDDLAKACTIAGIDRAKVRMDLDNYYLFLDTPDAPGILYEYGTYDETPQAHLLEHTEALGDVRDIIAIFQ